MMFIQTGWRATILLIFSVFAVQCSTQQNHMASDEPVVVRAVADSALEAIRNQDGERLAALVHPEKGVRFSPSAYVNLAEDVVFSRKQIVAFWKDSSTYLWGYAEGSGEPLKMTPAGYAQKYIMVGSEDFSNPSSISINNDKAFGTTRNNAAEIYAGATRVEYYIGPSADQALGGVDWLALRLVFEQEDDHWWLIAVIHDSWSI